MILIQFWRSCPIISPKCLTLAALTFHHKALCWQSCCVPNKINRKLRWKLLLFVCNGSTQFTRSPVVRAKDWHLVVADKSWNVVQATLDPFSLSFCHHPLAVLIDVQLISNDNHFRFMPHQLPRFIAGRHHHHRRCRRYRPCCRDQLRQNNVEVIVV